MTEFEPIANEQAEHIRELLYVHAKRVAELGYIIECLSGLRKPAYGMTPEECPYDMCLLPLGKGQHEEYLARVKHKLPPAIANSSPCSDNVSGSMRWEPVEINTQQLWQTQLYVTGLKQQLGPLRKSAELDLMTYAGIRAEGTPLRAVFPPLMSKSLVEADFASIELRPGDIDQMQQASSLNQLLKHEAKKHTSLRNLDFASYELKIATAKKGELPSSELSPTGRIPTRPEFLPHIAMPLSVRTELRDYFWPQGRSKEGCQTPEELAADVTRGEAVAKVIASFVCVTNDKNEVLLGYHHRRKSWEFPGGKAKPNETAIEAARRETFEETNLLLGPLKLVHCTESQDWFAVIFTAQAIDPSQLLDMEPGKQSEHAWYSVDDLPSPLYSTAEHHVIEAVCGRRAPEDMGGMRDDEDSGRKQETRQD